MRRFLFLFLWFSCGFVIADLQKNPDENTLWQITSPELKGWKGAGIKIEKRENGFSLRNESPSVKSPHSITRKVPVDPEYPYLVFETVAINTFKGYHAWFIGLRESQNQFGSVVNGEPGIVAINCFENPAKNYVKNQATLQFYMFNFKADLLYMKMVKKPDNYIAVTGDFSSGKAIQPGDKVKFTVYLKESAEEVSLKLIYKKWLYTIKVNGNELVELTPEDKDQKIWSAEVPVKSLKCSKGSSFKKGEILLRAVVLGGKVNTPLWSVLQYPFESKK